MVTYFICKGCKKEIKGKNQGRFFNFVFSMNEYCEKCSMMKATCLDRTGRSSKKDRYKNKDEKEWNL